MDKLRGLHFGSYWMGANDVVYLMQRDLADLCCLKSIDTGIYCNSNSNWYEEDREHNIANPVRWLDDQKVLSEVSEHKADVVVVNAGGMSLRPETIRTLQKEGVVTVGISLSDPDVFPYHGKVYAHMYDLYYTNSLFSLANQYVRNGKTQLLPFAASPRLHRPLPGIEKTYDVVVVGHARAGRLRTIEKLRKRYVVGVFGRGWDEEDNSVHGEAHVQSINLGKMYLSFSETGSGYLNVKVGVFEATACKTLVISEYCDEMEKYFKYGMEVVGYSEVSELVKIVGYYLEKWHLRAWIAGNSYDRLIKEHTWEARWKGVLDNIRRTRYGTG